MDFRPVFFVLGILLSTLAFSMLVPMLADLAVGHPDWQTFAISAAFTLFVGVSLLLTNRMPEFTLSIRQAFLLTTLSWMVTAAFAAVPLMLAELGLSYTDAFFEAMSGITTTGATVIVGLDSAPPGILLWRALLQWMGGIGIIVLALSVLPMLQVGGMQLFRTESSEKSDKVLPRAAQLATWIGLIYLAFTALCAVGYRLAGMEWFDAFAHAMTTIATGGFSTADASVAFFDDPLVELVGIVFMLAGALPFVLYLRALRGDLRPLMTDRQVQWFAAVVAAAIGIMAAHLWIERGYEPLSALRLASFNVVSVITGTGYATSDFGTWGPFAAGLMFFLMFVGGCAGSTSCGIKIFRFQVLYATADAQMRRLIQPHGVFIAYYNGKPIPEAVSVSVMSFFFLYALCFVALTLSLQLLGLDYLTAMSGAATAISNVGPGLGPVIGPSGTFAPLPDAAKWVLSAGMLMGRLELFTVLVLLTPAFWRQ
ncbi:TrkH family potassium uptake protein [Skermanella mucosa]|uniref:TrkH family potassium uptake protein n=1 Tax=Skermanella mucosa TaxID=1789672 RepID=UPI001E311624|nr:TrkH family potassium uptake protein [Skermanella mucosa]UEM20006.1 TrkH family potassium uptake protein [Skermanella mucosa]